MPEYPRRHPRAAPAAAVLTLAAVCGALPDRPPALAADAAPPPRPVRVGVVGDLAITGVTVIDTATGTARDNLTVVVRGDRITHVLPADTCTPAGDTRVIDGVGKYLIPGLWDMHAHLVHADLPPLFLRHGVTGVRHMLGVNPLFRYRPPNGPGTPPHPRVVAAHQALDGPATGWKTFLGTHPNVVTVEDADSARKAVRKLKQDGNDFVKVYSALPREAYLAAVEEAKALGMPVAGHIPHTVRVGEASDAGQLTVGHLGGIAFQCSKDEEDFRRILARGLAGGGAGRVAAATGWDLQVDAHLTRDPEKEAALFETFVRNGTWHVPTLAVDRALARLPNPTTVSAADEASLPEFVRVTWSRKWNEDGTVTVTFLGLTQTPAQTRLRERLLEYDLELVGRMHRAGVRLLAGTDAPAPLVVPGASLHDELALLVEAGLTPAAALRAATLSPAECLGRQQDLGTVEVGKLADLVLLARNPLDDIRNTTRIEVVVAGGRMLDRNR